MKKLIYISTILCFSISSFAQIDTTRNETHIFWSNSYQVQTGDFRDTTRSTKNINNCDKYNLCWGAYTGLFSVLDVPKKKRDKKKKHEAIYFVPAFELNTSYRLTSDSLDYLKQLIVFDMYEIAARKCRIELDSIYNTNPSIGIKGIFFKSVETDVQEKLGMMVKGYTQEVYIQQKDGAYTEWRTLIDELLEETKEYQTTAIDRLRFIKNEPILNGYIKAKKVAGNLFEGK